MSRAVRMHPAVPAKAAGPVDVWVPTRAVTMRLDAGVRDVPRIVASASCGPTPDTPRVRAYPAAPSREPLHRRSQIRWSSRAEEGASPRHVVATLLLTALATIMLLTLAHVRTEQVITRTAGVDATIVHEADTPPGPGRG